MVLAEAVLLIGLVGAVLYGFTVLFLRSQVQNRPSAIPGRWRVAHYDVQHETRVVLQKSSESGRVLDEHIVAVFRADDPAYDDKFLTAMSAARQRQALFEAEDDHEAGPGG